MGSVSSFLEGLWLPGPEPPPYAYFITGTDYKGPWVALVNQSTTETINFTNWSLHSEETKRSFRLGEVRVLPQGAVIMRVTESWPVESPRLLSHGRILIYVHRYVFAYPKPPEKSTRDFIRLFDQNGNDVSRVEFVELPPEGQLTANAPAPKRAGEDRKKLE